LQNSKEGQGPHGASIKPSEELGASLNARYTDPPPTPSNRELPIGDDDRSRLVALLDLRLFDSDSDSELELSSDGALRFLFFRG